MSHRCERRHDAPQRAHRAQIRRPGRNNYDLRAGIQRSHATPPTVAYAICLRGKGRAEAACCAFSHAACCLMLDAKRHWPVRGGTLRPRGVSPSVARACTKTRNIRVLLISTGFSVFRVGLFREKSPPRCEAASHESLVTIFAPAALDPQISRTRVSCTPEQNPSLGNI